MARLSVIVPTLDEADGIAATLAALQPLRAAGHEIIVADGGSRDGTTALAAPYADQIITAPRGRAHQMNAGARHARGDVLLFLHADTALPPDAGQLILAGLLSSGRCWGHFDVQLSGRRLLLRIIERGMNLRARLTGITTGDQGIFVTRAAFEAVGGYPGIPLMEDITLSRALKHLGRPLCLRAQVITSSRRWEQQGILRTVLFMWRLRLAYFCGADPQRLARAYHPR